MAIHIIRQPATEKEFQEMLEELAEYIKVAVDIKQGILAGGGEYHADCEEVLLEDGRSRCLNARIPHFFSFALKPSSCSRVGRDD